MHERTRLWALACMRFFLLVVNWSVAAPDSYCSFWLADILAWSNLRIGSASSIGATGGSEPVLLVEPYDLPAAAVRNFVESSEIVPLHTGIDLDGTVASNRHRCDAWLARRGCF